MAKLQRPNAAHMLSPLHLSACGAHSPSVRDPPDHCVGLGGSPDRCSQPKQGRPCQTPQGHLLPALSALVFPLFVSSCSFPSHPGPVPTCRSEVLGLRTSKGEHRGTEEPLSTASQQAANAVFRPWVQSGGRATQPSPPRNSRERDPLSWAAIQVGTP